MFATLTHLRLAFFVHSCISAGTSGMETNKPESLRPLLSQTMEKDDWGNPQLSGTWQPTQDSDEPGTHPAHLKGNFNNDVKLSKL